MNYRGGEIYNLKVDVLYKSNILLRIYIYFCYNFYMDSVLSDIKVIQYVSVSLFFVVFFSVTLEFNKKHRKWDLNRSECKERNSEICCWKKYRKSILDERE